MFAVCVCYFLCFPCFLALAYKFLYFVTGLLLKCY